MPIRHAFYKPLYIEEILPHAWSLSLRQEEMNPGRRVSYLTKEIECPQYLSKVIGTLLLIIINKLINILIKLYKACF
jgi:hypothetical protein